MPDAKFCLSVDLTTPIGTQFLTKGLNLAAIDKLAMEQLNGGSLDGRAWDEVMALARTCNNGEDVAKLPLDRVS